MPATFASAEAALQVFCPPLYGMGATIRAFWLEIAANQLAEASLWGDRYYDAVALVAAHEWQRLSGGNAAGLSVTAAEVVGAVGGESSSKDGRSLSRSYVNFTPIEGADAEWNTTRYGSAFLKIRNSRASFGTRLITL